jgi:hypothetical protein
MIKAAIHKSLRMFGVDLVKFPPPEQEAVTLSEDEAGRTSSYRSPRESGISADRRKYSFRSPLVSRCQGA